MAPRVIEVAARTPARRCGYRSAQPTEDGKRDEAAQEVIAGGRAGAGCRKLSSTIGTATRPIASRNSRYSRRRDRQRVRAAELARSGRSISGSANGTAGASLGRSMDHRIRTLCACHGRSFPSRDGGSNSAQPPPKSVRYSYWSASRTLRREARRAGRIAASTPARIATQVKSASGSDRERELHAVLRERLRHEERRGRFRAGSRARPRSAP